MCVLYTKFTVQTYWSLTGFIPLEIRNQRFLYLINIKIDLYHNYFM